MRFSSWMVASVLALGGCSVSTPFEGPGYDRKNKVTLGDAETQVVAVTNGQLRGSSSLRSRFWDQVSRVEASLADRNGFVGHSKRRALFGDEV